MSDLSVLSVLPDLSVQSVPSVLVVLSVSSVLLPCLLPFWTLLPLRTQDVSNPLEVSVKKRSTETGTISKGKRGSVSVLSVCADLYLVSA